MENLPYILTPIVALAITICLMPLVRKAALFLDLVDKPNARKVHTSPVPLVGGIMVWIASFTAFLIFNHDWKAMDQIMVILVGSSIILIMGVLDDKFDIKAYIKLVIQLGLAYYAFAKGIRIDSFYGIFGIYEIPIFLQYILTLCVIAGVINAFNLMDGIDGLAAGISIVALSVLTYLAVITNNYFIIFLFIALIGSLIGFLFYNFSKKRKVFMGDAGSLFLGFIIIVSSIMMLQSSVKIGNQTKVLAIIISVMALPVFDSIRVYRKRLKRGYSPFRADKTHIHHLVLKLGLKHKYATLLIILLSLGIVITNIVFEDFMGLTFSILAMIFIFGSASFLLNLNQNITEWKEKIKIMENRE